jgi:hypothetical protein
MVIRVRGTSRPQDTKVDHPVLTAAGLNLLCASPDIAPVTAEDVQERPRPKSPHVGEGPRTNVAGCRIAPTCLAGSGSSPREVGYLKRLNFLRINQDHRSGADNRLDLTTPHPRLERTHPRAKIRSRRSQPQCLHPMNWHHQLEQLRPKSTRGLNRSRGRALLRAIRPLG